MKKREILIVARAWADCGNPGYWEGLSWRDKIVFGKCAKASIKALDAHRRNEKSAASARNRSGR